MFGDRVCVPLAMRPAALQFLHEGHPGVALMQERARNILFWPRITKDIWEFVEVCIPCAQTASARPKEPLLPSPPPAGPGDQVAADFCSFRSKAYLVFYDVFCNFPFLFPVARESTFELLRCTRQVFLQTGLPTVFASDNGAAFASAEFQVFLTSCGTTHRASSPRYPQSNGAAERAVQTLKRLLERCPDEASLFRAILHLQNTRRPDLGASPSELFFGRSQRTPITPCPQQHLRPWTTQHAALAFRRQTQAKYYDRATRVFVGDMSGRQAVLKDFVGPVVIVSVLSPAPVPRAYYVRLPSGVVTIHNQRFLRPFPRCPETSRLPSFQPSRSSPASVDVRRLSPVPQPAPFDTSRSVTDLSGPLSWLATPPSSTRVFVPSTRHRPSSVRRLMTPLPSTSAAGSPASHPPSPVTESASSSVHGSPAASSTSWTSAPRATANGLETRALCIRLHPVSATRRQVHFP